MLRKNPLRQRQFRELSLAMHMCWKTMILHLNVGENYVGEDSGGRNYVCRCNCFGELCLPIHKWWSTMFVRRVVLETYVCPCSCVWKKAVRGTDKRINLPTRWTVQPPRSERRSSSAVWASSQRSASSLVRLRTSDYKPFCLLWTTTEK